ncbi:MAG: RNA-binding protein [Acidobacteriota bacterium]|nr:RNA-binding protein [Acidobacteriota bacterium]
MKNIFVGNLSFGATEDAIRQMFEAYGTVDRVSVVTDRDTGQARGFGFVEMSNNAEGDRAIAELNGRELDGRALNVNEARPKEDRGGFGGGGGGRGKGGGGGFGGQRRNNRY